MKIIEPSIRILAASGYEPPEVPFSYTVEPELLIEYAGRTCYASRDKIAPGTAKEFVKRLRAKGHLSVLEHSWRCEPCGLSHGSIAGNMRAWEEYAGYTYFGCMDKKLKAATFHVVCDRGVSHELVRHRTFSVSQKSTRYVAEKGDIAFIKPCWCDEDSRDFWFWKESMANIEQRYYQMRKAFDWRPEQARSVLPNSLATELVVTGPLSAWQHFCKLRCDKAAHPQMRQIAEPIRDELKRLFPEHFGEVA